MSCSVGLSTILYVQCVTCILAPESSESSRLANHLPALCYPYLQKEVWKHSNVLKDSLDLIRELETALASCSAIIRRHERTKTHNGRTTSAQRPLRLPPSLPPRTCGRRPQASLRPSGCQLAWRSLNPCCLPAPSDPLLPPKPPCPRALAFLWYKRPSFTSCNNSSWCAYGNRCFYK